MVHRFLARFNAPTRRFALSMRRGNTFQGPPSSPPIKGDSLLFIGTTYKRRRAPKSKSKSTTPWA
jgi:hypothetical protein